MDVDSLEENKQLFFQSCKDGSLATVQQLLTHSDIRAHIDSLTDDDGNTALIVASENGHKGIVKLLLECGVNVNKRTPNGWTALMKASERGDSNLEVIDLLLRHGAQADLQNNEGDSALIVATQNRQTELVIKLVRDHRANVDLKNNKGWTALMKASQVGYVEAVELLLNHGAEVDQQCSDGYSALMLASQNGHIRLVKLLLKFHAKVDIKANDNKTALVLASQQKHPQAVELLLEYGAKDNLDITLACVAAIKEVHINTIKLLLELKAQVNYRQWGTLSALEGASENGRIDIVKLLLDHGSHEFLGLAIKRASRNGHIYIVKLLLEHGADYLGWALVEAILNKHDDITELLLKYGAKVDEDDWFHILDEPPLIIAVEKGDTDMVKLLLEHGAKQEMGWAITEAIWNEHAEIVQLLSERGAQVDDDDRFEDEMLDEPALVTASMNGNSNVVKLLLEHGAKKYLGWAITEAIRNEHAEIVQLLSERGAQVDDDDYFEYEMLDKPALVTASMNGNSNVVKLLLEHGAKKHLGWAITEAIQNEHAEIVQLLSERGAQVDDDDRFEDEMLDEPALVTASMNGNSNVVKLLLEHGAKKHLGWAITEAIWNEHAEIVQLLSERGAQVDDDDRFEDEMLDEPALVTASMNGNSNVVKLLLEHGAKKYLGWTITEAIRNEHAEIVQLLSECGAQVDDDDRFEDEMLDEPALITASMNGNSNVVKLLLEHGAKKYLGWALTEAILKEHDEIIQLLSERGAQVDDDDRFEDEMLDEPALITASMNGNSNVVKLLLEHGAKKHLGWALTEAILKEHDEIIQLLSERGAQVDNDDRLDYFMLDEPPLVTASISGNTNIVKLLLEHGAKKHLGWALTEAIKHKHIEVTKVLLEHGVSVDEISDDDRTPLIEVKENLQTALILACQKGNTDVIQLLLNNGAQVNAEISERFAIVEASKNGHTEAIKLLLKHGAKLQTALIEASRNGHAEVVKLLLEKGARVNVQDSNGRSALITASENSHIAVVRILFEHNALVNWQDNDGQSALMLACQNGHIQIIKMLLGHDARINLQDNGGLSALMKASYSGHTQIAQLLIQNGAFVNQQSSKGSSALYCASSSGHTEVVKLLLQHDSNSSLYDNNGRSALIIASRNGHYEVVRLLLKHGDQVDQQDNDGVTALMLASQEGHTKLVELLLQEGSNVQLQDKNGSHALLKASHNGHNNVVKVLLKHDAFVNQQRNDGWSPLMAACSNGFIDSEVVKTLLEYDVQVDLQDHDGWSPLMKTSQTGRTDVLKLLLEHGAEVNLQSRDGYYALMAASEEGYIEVVKLLLKHGGQVDLEDNIGRSAFTAARNTEILLAFFALNTDMPEIGSFQDIPQNNPQHKSFDENKQEKHLIAIENAIRDRGQLDHTLVHGVFVGPPRSGKDSLMKRLLGEKMITDNSPSTGVAESIVHVKVEESSTFAATVELSNWTRLAYDEEALHLIKTASNKSLNVDQLHKETSDENVIAESIELTPKEIERTSQQIQERSVQINVKSSEESLMSEFMSPLEEIFQTPAHPDSQLSNKHKSPMEIFKEAIKSKGLEGFKKQLLKSWSLYLTNTGGQMEFQELLPLLVSGPSIFFITFQLHKDLDQHFLVEYELPSGKSSQSYQSSLSILESILHTLSSISAMGTYVYKGLQRKAVPLRPKVFIIGTHKDLLNKKLAKAEIKSIDEHLQAVLKSTSHYHEGIIQFASESQMIFAVNNHDLDDSDFKRIRTAVEKVVETGDYRMRSPAHWMIYSLVVRQLKNRVESYEECFAIAKECGIRDTNEFNEALHFIHTKMGLVRYFPHEQLKDLVIVNPQILFEKVTELIVETFTFEKVCNHSKLEIFKNMGIFKLSDFTRISNRTGQNLTPPLFAKLLEHLRIAAPFQQGGETKYFLPCALTHAQEKHYTPASTLPQLIVIFQCGYCPKGLFGTLVTFLINNEMQSEFEWELVTEKIYRDEVCFQVGPYDTVTLRFLPTHIEIACIESNPDLPRINCTEESVCHEIYQSVEKGIKTVTSAINYINAQHSFTFYCTSESCSKDLPHPAKLKRFKGKLCSLKCDKLNKCFPLPSGFEKWQLDSSPQVFEPTTEVCHDPKEKLDRCYCSSLIYQLSNCAANWREIGTHLGFQQGELNNILAKPLLLSGAPQSWLSDLLSQWMEWAPGDSRGSTKYATLEDLKSAVSKAGFGVVAAGLSLDSSPQVFEPTTEVYYDTEFKTRLEKRHHVLLFRQLSRYASQWREIGIYLGFLNDELDIIVAKPSLYHEGAKGFLCEMLSEWLEWAPGDQRGSKEYATLEALKRAVSSAGLGATAEHLTVNIETSYLTSKDVKETCSTSQDINIRRTACSENYYLYSAKNCVIPHFLDEIKDVQFDSSGLEHKISVYDITVRIPEGSIPKGQTVHLKVGAALNGPFKHSSRKRPISPILWLCPEGELTLSKPVEIVLPHILTDVTNEDVKKFGIQVSKATHGDFSSQKEYLFKPFESEDIKFESNEYDNYAIVRVTHCCFWCLEANRREQMTSEIAQQMGKKVGYSMHCIECLQSPYPDLPSTKVIHFCVSFTLMKCLKVKINFCTCMHG